jgi:hypothetical protein
MKLLASNVPLDNAVVLKCPEVSSRYQSGVNYLASASPTGGPPACAC